MKRVLPLVMILSLPAGSLWAVTEALFTSVTGKVQIKGLKHAKPRAAEKDAKVVEGESVLTGPDSKATLKTFDGSEIQISPNSDLRLEKLQKPGGQDKVIHFKLNLGMLLAKVTHLLSSKSSFEIEAGGVICGVRGTEYSVFYDPASGKVDVVVKDGTVWSNSDGKTQIFHAGQGGSYLNGIFIVPPPPPGDKHPGFISSNPFYGFNGTGQDDFNNPLSDLPGGLDGVTGQIGSNGVAGLGAHNLLSLRLNFPQYLP